MNEQSSSHTAQTKSSRRAARRGLELEILEDRWVPSGNSFLSPLPLPQLPAADVTAQISADIAEVQLDISAEEAQVSAEVRVDSGPAIEATVVLSKEPSQDDGGGHDTLPEAPPGSNSGGIISPVLTVSADISLGEDTHVSAEVSADSGLAIEATVVLGEAPSQDDSGGDEVLPEDPPGGNTDGSDGDGSGTSPETPPSDSPSGNDLPGQSSDGSGSEQNSPAASVAAGAGLTGTGALDLAFARLGTAAEHSGFSQNAAALLEIENLAADGQAAEGIAGNDGGSLPDELFPAPALAATAEANLVLPAGEGAAPDLLPGAEEEMSSEPLTDFSLAGEGGIEALLQQLLARLNRLGQDASDSLMSRELVFWIVAGALAGGTYAYSRRRRRAWEEKDQPGGGNSSWKWLSGSGGFTPRVAP